jgi:hypothetical protein
MPQQTAAEGRDQCVCISNVSNAYSPSGPGAPRRGRTSYHPIVKTSGITAALPAQDLDRAKAFYVEKAGLQVLESDFLKARDGQVGLTGWRWRQPALRLSRPGQVVRGVHAGRHPCDRRARRRRRDEGPRRGVRGVRHAGDTDRKRHCPDAGWRRGGVVQGLGRQPGRPCSSLRRIRRFRQPTCRGFAPDRGRK